MSRGTQVSILLFSVLNTGLSPSLATLPIVFLLPIRMSDISTLQHRSVETQRFGLFPFRSPLLWESRLISSPPGTEMFHFPGFAFAVLMYSDGNCASARTGFPHSDIFGSMDV